MKKNGSYYPSFEKWLGKYFDNMRKAKTKISLVKLEGMALKIKSEMLKKRCIFLQGSERVHSPEEVQMLKGLPTKIS